ncbi:hypothetical protein [Halosimplex sp. TS25]|uniref:hypothetical protein n=1 Tax=Halosimplex rarum TaxID=3396619 RepID=UPI0039EB80F8
MRPALYWLFSVVVGVAVAAVTWEYADWHVAGVALGLVYVVGIGLVCRAHLALRSRIDSWKRPSLWAGAFGGLTAFTATTTANAVSDSSGTVLAVTLAVFGAGIVGVAAGVGIALENLDRPGQRPADGDPHPATSDG